MYAVNLVALVELTYMPQHLPLLWLLRDIVTETRIQPLPGMSHEALLVADDVSAERWHAIVEIVRKRFSYQ